MLFNNGAGARAALLVMSGVMLVVAGCKGKEALPGTSLQVESKPSPDASKQLPKVTLTGADLTEDAVNHCYRINISASGTFNANVIEKADPDRIVVIMHNAEKGIVPSISQVNNKTIKSIETAQLDTGRGPAVRITITLTGAALYRTVSSDGSMVIEVKMIG